MDARHRVSQCKGAESLIAHWHRWQTWVLALLLLFAASLHAQYRTSIQGTVTDPQGAVIPGAILTLKNLSTNEMVVRTSDEVGVFNFNALPANHFTLTVEKDGFKKKILDDLQLIPEQANSLNIELEIGAAAQVVTVDASTTPAIDTQTANTSHTISENDIQHMPVFERDATSLIQLAPGVLADGSHQSAGAGFQAPGTQTGASSGGGGNLGSTSSIFATENGASANTNGNQFENNGYTVDGISTVSAVWGGSTIITPSEDSISNIKIVTNAYDAENGRFSGAMTEITSKSGSNNIHGSFFMEIARPGLNAYQRWNGPSSVASTGPNGVKLTPEERGLLRNTNRYNQYGGSVGGPIWKNKIFAFFNYEGQKQNTPATGTGWYSTTTLASLAPSGSIASTYLHFKGANVLGTLIGSATCQDAGLTENVNCKTIAGQGLNIGSPLTTGLGKQDLTYVNNATPGIGSGLSNIADIAEYTTNSPTSSDFKQYNGRLDANVTGNDRLSFAIYWVPNTRTNYNGGFGYDFFNHSQVNNAFSLIWNHTFSPTFLNEARANAAGWRWNELTTNPQAPFGLPQDFLPGSGQYGTQIGNINLGAWGVGAPSHLNQWTYSYKDVATKVLRTHTMKFGFDFTRLNYLNDPIGAPNYTFYNLWDFMNDAPEAEGGPFQATTGIPGGYRNDNRENILGIFFQDDWKVSPTLTLSAGLRYSYLGPLTDKAKNMGVLKFGSGSTLLTGIALHTGIGAWEAQKLNYGPQFGFNWSPAYFNSRLVVRGGFGLNYNQQQIATANAGDYNPPGTNYISSSSKGPTEINPNVVYAISSSPTSIFGYPANKNAITTFNSAGLPTAGGANIGGFPASMPTQYLEHYSLDVEYDLGHSLIANLGYLGSVGRHLLYNYDANAFGHIMGAPLNPLVNSINTFGSGGKSSNNMMLAGLKHEFSHTFSAEAQFTWAHSMDTNSGPYSRDPYLYNPGYSYGRSDFDINRSFKVFGIWQPVIFHGNYGWAEKIAGGWSLSGIMTLHSGFGWTPVFNAPHQFYCNSCNYGYPNLRPYYLGEGGKSTNNNAFKTGSNFANPGTINTGTNNNSFSDNYFSIPSFDAAIADNPGQSATAYIPAPGIDRNVFPGPGYRNIDVTVAKAFGLPKMRVVGENGRIEIKANMLNLFNLLNINPSTINTNIANGGLGQARGALGARTVDFQARFSF
ncbi:MAG TPA: carboxypeptidase regulatory-like domain-containing protein [Terracidiphilus sp.]|nr:carboxypeptidase regulatory-like domain-containing protein [Terracidiphilus sp.]